MTQPLEASKTSETLARSVEWGGFAPIPESQRKGKPSNQFNIWFGSQVHMSALVLGAIGITAGLGLAGTVTAIIVGNVLASLGTAACSAMGPRYGMPQMALGRGPFGYHGNFLLAFIATLHFLGYSVVGLVLCSSALQLIWPSLPTSLIVVILGIIGPILALYGYQWIHRFSRWLTLISLISFIALTILTIASSRTSSLSSTLGSDGGFWKHWLVQMTVAFSFTVGWSDYASDYSRYLPRSTSRIRVYLYTFVALSMSTSWVMALGALLTTASAKGGALAAIQITASQAFGDIVLVILVISQMVSIVFNMYSGGMSCLTWGLPVKRWTAVGMISIISLILALAVAGPRFTPFYTDFLLAIGYVITPWLAIMLIYYYDLTRAAKVSVKSQLRALYDGHGPHHGIRISGYAAFLVGLAASVPFISTNVYTGPIAKMLGHSNVSFFVGFMVAGAIYYALKPRVLHRLSAVEFGDGDDVE